MDYKIDELSINVRGEMIRDDGDPVIIPVEVLNLEGAVIMTRTVQLNRDIWNYLQEQENFESEILSACRNRVLIDLKNIQSAGSPDTGAKVRLMKAPPARLA